MKPQTLFSSKLMIFLISMVLGCLIAIIVPSLFFDIFLLAFFKQILIVVSIWFCFGIAFYFFISWWINRSNVFNALFAVDLSFQQMIRKVFLSIFFLFPVCLIASQHFREFFQILIHGKVYNSIDDGAGSFLIGVLAVGLFLILMLYIVAGKPRLRQQLDDMPDYCYILFILLTGILIRSFFIYSINTQPISDFANINLDALLVSMGERPTHIYSSTNIMVTMVYGLLYDFFGPDLMVIKFFHGLIYGLSGIFIFYTGKQIFESKLWAGIFGVLLVLWPSLAIYSNVLTPEHLFIFAECAFLFVVSWFFKRQETLQRENAGSYLLMFALIGLLFGLSGMFRPFGGLFLMAFVITFFVYIARHERMILNLSGLFIMFMVFWVVGKVPMGVTKYYHVSFANFRPCNLLVGVNVDASGQYNEEDVNLCIKVLSQASDESEFNHEITKIVLGRLSNEEDSLVSLVDKKFSILWTNSNGIIFWAVQYNLLFFSDLAQNVSTIDFIFMFIGTIFCLIGTAIAFFKDVKPVIFFCQVSFFGFNLMEVFLEVQTRYRTVVMPLFILFICWTFAAISSYTRKNNQKITGT